MLYYHHFWLLSPSPYPAASIPLHSLLGMASPLQKGHRKQCTFGKDVDGIQFSDEGQRTRVTSRTKPSLALAPSRALTLTESLQHVTVEQKKNPISLSYPEMEMLWWEPPWAATTLRLWEAGSSWKSADVLLWVPQCPAPDFRQEVERGHSHITSKQSWQVPGCPSHPPALQAVTGTAFRQLPKAQKPCKGCQQPATDQESLTGTKIIHLEWVEGKGRHITEIGVSIGHV